MAKALPAQRGRTLPIETRADSARDERFAGWERKADLMVARPNSGRIPSDSVVEDWSRLGVVPHGIQHWAAGVVGSVVCYPPGTADAVRAACAIYQLTQDPEEIAWQLWWYGFPVEAEYALQILAARVARFDAVVERFLRWVTPRPSSGISKRGWSLLKSARTHRVRDALFRQMRKRVGPELWDTWIGRLVDVLRGEFTGWSFDPSPAQDRHGTERVAFERGLGVSGWPLKTADSGRSDDPVEEVLRLVNDRVGGAGLSSALKGQTHASLCATRTELRAVLMVALVEPVGREPQTWSKRLGLKVLASVVAIRRSIYLAPMLAAFLALKRDQKFQENLDRLLAAILANSGAEKASVNEVEIARRIDPALVEFLVGKPQ